MILSLLFTAAPSLGPVALASFTLDAPAAAIQADAAKEEEYKKRYEAAGADVAKLMELSQWCEENTLREQKRAVLKRVLEIDANNEPAHTALRHHFYDGKWFETYAELSSYKRDEAKRMLDEKGLVRFKDQWVPEADVNFMRMGWTKDETGKWVSQAAVDRAKLDAERLAAGWVRQTDLVWVPKEETQNWQQGKWKCGDQWLSIDDANKFHAEIGRWWTLPGQRFLILSTCDYETGWLAANQADQAYDDLVRFFGVQPTSPPEIVVLSSIEQYNSYAAGDQAAGRAQVEANGYSSCHYAFFADLRFEGTPESIEYKGCGVGYWNAKDPNLAPFGKHSVRHAAAHSYAEIVDPSFDTISKAAANPGNGIPEADFWAEKRMPRWMRYGIAAYVDRYYQDAYSEDAWWPRKWAIANLVQNGPIDPFEKVFAFQLDPADGTGRIISEAGLVVSFILDGKCPPVIGAHRKLKAMLTRGESSKEAVAELEKALVDNRAAFDAYVQTIQS